MYSDLRRRGALLGYAADYQILLAMFLCVCIITSMTQQTRKYNSMTKPTQKIGPKHKLVNPMPRNLMLTEAVIDKARRIGKGKLSAGGPKAGYKKPPERNYTPQS